LSRLQITAVTYTVARLGEMSSLWAIFDWHCRLGRPAFGRLFSHRWQPFIEKIWQPCRLRLLHACIGYCLFDNIGWGRWSTPNSSAVLVDFLLGVSGYCIRLDRKCKWQTFEGTRISRNRECNSSQRESCKGIALTPPPLWDHFGHQAGCWPFLEEGGEPWPPADKSALPKRKGAKCCLGSQVHRSQRREAVILFFSEILPCLAPCGLCRVDTVCYGSKLLFRIM